MMSRKPILGELGWRGHAGFGTVQGSSPLWLAYTPQHGSSHGTLVPSDVHAWPHHTAAVTLGHSPLTLCPVITGQSPVPLAQHTRSFRAG